MSELSREELMQLVYVPGSWKCDLCGFEQNNRTLHVSTGDVTAPTIEEIPICPNRHSLKGEAIQMRRLTWKEASEANYEFATTILKREPRYSDGEEPTEPGWYWCKNVSTEPPGIWEAVVRVDYIDDSLHAMWFSAPGEMKTQPKAEWSPDAKWARLEYPQT